MGSNLWSQQLHILPSHTFITGHTILGSGIRSQTHLACWCRGSPWFSCASKMKPIFIFVLGMGTKLVPSSTQQSACFMGSLVLSCSSLGPGSLCTESYKPTCAAQLRVVQDFDRSWYTGRPALGCGTLMLSSSCTESYINPVCGPAGWHTWFYSSQCME